MAIVYQSTSEVGILGEGTGLAIYKATSRVSTAGCGIPSTNDET